MRLLAIDCATDACSVALFDGDEVVDSRCELLGRGHAERLVPMIADLPDRGRAEEIRVGLGPGSFTGTRIGLAAARALAVAWRARVLGYPTLALVAAMAGERSRPGPVLVAMAGGHGEWFVQPFEDGGTPARGHASLPPAEAAMSSGIARVAGSRAAGLVELRGHGEALDILPDARRVLEIPSSLLTSDLRPIYGRPPDARPRS